MGHEDAFPPAGLSARCRFSQRTFAGTLGNERDAPKIGIGGHLAVPSLPHHRAYGSLPGGSTRLSLVRNMKSRETERIEVVVAQGLLDRRVSGHAPEPRRQTSGDRGSKGLAGARTAAAPPLQKPS